MAGDTRDPTSTTSPSSSIPPPPKTYETFKSSSTNTTSQPTPPPSANALPLGSGLNTAGSPSHQPPPRLTDAIQTLRVEDFKQVHMYPCVRDSLLTGIAGGFAMGGVRSLSGAPIPKSANWAVGAFIFASLGSYEYCLYKRQIERSHMKRAVEIMDRKKVEKEMEARRVREERRVKEETEKAQRGDEERRRRERRWWKVW